MRTDRHAFINWREIVDTGSWGDLAWHLEGRGVGSLEYERRRREYGPQLSAFVGYFNAERLTLLMNLPKDKAAQAALMEELRAPLDALLGALAARATVKDDAGMLKPCNQSLFHWHREYEGKQRGNAKDEAEAIDAERWAVPIAYALLKPVSVALARGGDLHDGARWLDAWLMTEDVVAALTGVLGDAWRAEQASCALHCAMRNMLFPPD